MAIQKGYATPEHLYRAFLYEFGNMDKPQSKQASSGGVNYIYQLTQHIQAEEVVGQEVSMRAPHPKATSRGSGGDANVADNKQLNPLMEAATDDPSQQ